MKTTSKLALAVVVVGGAYTATSWWLGGQIEEQYQSWFDQASEQLDGQLRWQRSYTRGLFTSSQDWTLDIPMPAGDDSDHRVTVQLHSDIQHGPVADGKLAAGIDRTRVTALQGLPPELDDIELDGTLTATTVQELGGAWHSTIRVPGGRGQIPLPDVDGDLAVQWQPMTSSIQGKPGQPEVSGSLQWPSAQVAVGQADSQGKLALADWTSRFDLTLGADGWLLAPGHISTTVGRLEVSDSPADGRDGSSTTISLSDIEHDLERSATDDVVNLQQNTTARGQFGSFKLDKVESEQKLQNLDKQALRQLQPLVLAALSAPDPEDIIDESKLESSLQRLVDAGPSYDEQTRITLDGDAGHLNWGVALAPKDAEMAGMDLPLQFELLTRLQGQADLRLPRSWLPMVAEALQDEDVTEADLQDDLDALVGQGFLQADDDAYTAQGSYDQGQLTVNGQTLFDLR